MKFGDIWALDVLYLLRSAFRRHRLSCREAAFLAAWRWSCVQKQWSLPRQVTNVTSQDHWLSCLMWLSSQHQVCCCCSWPPCDIPAACSGGCWLFLLMAGVRAETSSRLSGTEGYETEGIRGLRALGVRELSYKLVFLACYVAPTNPRVSLQRKIDPRVLKISTVFSPQIRGVRIGKAIKRCVYHLSLHLTALIFWLSLRIKFLSCLYCS